MGEFFYDSTTQRVIDADWRQMHRRRAEPIIRVKKTDRDNFRTQEQDALPDNTWDLSDIPEPSEADIIDNAYQMGIPVERYNPDEMDMLRIWLNQDK